MRKVGLKTAGSINKMADLPKDVLSLACSAFLFIINISNLWEDKMKLKCRKGSIFNMSIYGLNRSLMIKSVSIMLLSLLYIFTDTSSADMTLFGPKQFQRTTGEPNIFQETFVATAGEGWLGLFNGGLSRGSEVTSAVVTLNGGQVLGPDDFKRGYPFLEIPVTLEAVNSLEITLASEPGTYVIVRLTQSFPFEEDESGVSKADLAVTDLVLTPDRLESAGEVGMLATVTNWGRQDSGESTLIFTAGGDEIGREGVNSLAVGASASFSMNWTPPPGAGRHQIWARIEPGMGMIDPYPANNSRMAALRVSIPGLEFSPPLFHPGSPATITLEVKNPGSVDLSNIWLWFDIPDTSPLPETAIYASATPVFGHGDCGDIVCPPPLLPDLVIESLFAGESREVSFDWPYDSTVGHYTVHVRAGNLPDDIPEDELIANWDLVLPTILPSWNANQPPWYSLGPYLITNNFSQGPPNTGRIAALAVHPNDPKIIYAADASLGLQITGTGLWKTTDGGQHWKALGDKFPQMNIMTIAIDPGNPDIVYCAGGVWRFDPPKPVAQGLPNQITGYIFKSIDGGQHWSLFGHPADGYSKLVVRRLTGGNEVVIYAASNRGVLRYKSSNPTALSSQESEWPIILDGKISDVLVDPSDTNVAFAVRNVSTGQTGFQLDGLYRTKIGLTASGNSDWSRRVGFATPTPGRLMFVDLFKTNPQKVYVLTMDPTTTEIRKSEMGGDTFDVVYSFPTPFAYVQLKYKSIASFLRAHPSIDNLLYVGCAIKDLFRIYKKDNSWYKFAVGDIHADQKAMEFFPDASSASGWGYILGNDGGVYRGVYTKEFYLDKITPINYGLISAEFYDVGFDVFLSDPDIMIGGTQDNGIILSQTESFGNWQYVGTGDGTAAVIAPTDSQTMYGKDSDGLHSGILRSTNGGSNWQGTKHIGVIDGGGAIFTDPDFANTIYLGSPANKETGSGAQVQMSSDAGDNWTQIGPSDSQEKGNIVQVLMSTPVGIPYGPQGILYAGTDKYGQIWARYVSSLGWVWSLIDMHPDPDASVKSMALVPSDPNALLVVYNNCTKDKRLRRFHVSAESGWTGEWITGNLPEIHATSNTKLEVSTIAAHPTDEDTLFVGTDKGVYQGRFFGDSWTWLPFNNGLPLVRISKLISIPLTEEIRAATSGRGVWSVQF